jgi:alkanesulfonate monooxygenase SsuD/methylene tetrahydromethanopterin reductase-like flavin-dependent oxidoreductase (luciferase family)
MPARLAAAAQYTRRLTPATGIITLALENPVRLAEDAAVLVALSNGRLELGFGTGGGEPAFSIFDVPFEDRQQQYDRAFAVVRDALAGQELTAAGSTLFPPARPLLATLWEATFGVPGAVRAAEHGSGLLLARTAVRPGRSGASQATARHRPLGEVQSELVEAYLGSWSHPDIAPRIGLSRSLYVAPTRVEAFREAEPGLRRSAAQLAGRAGIDPHAPLADLITRSDLHLGGPEDVIASLRADRLLPLATDLILQLHPADPGHQETLRSLELVRNEVAPSLGWSPATALRASQL